MQRLSHGELLADDRVLRRGAELIQLMECELLYLDRLPHYVWKRCAALISADFDAEELRSLALPSAHATSWRSAQRRACTAGSESVESYAGVVLEDNLAQLERRTDDIRDKTTQEPAGSGLPKADDGERA